MTKAKKGLIITLFAAMMVFAFGATTAFAGQPGSADEGHDFTVLPDKSNVEYVVEPTCTTAGYGIVTCTLKHGDIECKAKHNEVIPALRHAREAKAVTVTAKEYYDQMLKQGYTEDYMDAWMTRYGDKMCTGTVSVCKNCGAFLREGTNTLSDPELFGQYANTEHVAPTTGMKPCDASFTCVKCGKAEATNATYNPEKSAAYHGLNVRPWVPNENFKEKGSPYHVHSVDNDSKYVEVQRYECEECGLEMKTQRLSDGAKWSDFSHPNTETMTTMSTCTENGTSVVVCKDCGYEVSRTETPALGHKYAKQTVAKATEHHGEMVADKCTVCGYVDASTVETVSLPISHNVEATVFAPKNCADNTTVLVECTNPDCTLGENSSFFVDTTSTAAAHSAQKIGDKYYTTFDTGRVEIPFQEAAGHTYGDVKVLAEATCTTPKVEGRECSTCGAIYHTGTREVGKALGHTPLEEVVAPTCGDPGYTHSTCTVCGDELDKQGRGEDDPDQGAIVWDKTKPVVSYGAECSYEWKVLTPATPFVEGTQAKVCTVCGDVEFGTKESIAKTTIAAPAVKAKKGKKAVVTVKAVEGAVSYQILVNGKVKVANAKVGKNTVKKLTGKKAKVQIKAFDANGVAAKSKAKTVKVKK